MTIVTHTAPDFDAIGACWLLQRYGGMQDASVVFVNTGNPDPAILANADAVVDTGREYDPARLRFDHHHYAGAAANETCATLQTFQFLNKDGALCWLTPLIDLIYAGDTGKPEASESRQIGIHALLSAKKARRASNEELLAYGYEILDLLAERLNTQYETQQTLSATTIYRSDDRLVVALKYAPQGATYAAMEAGARIVLFQSSYPDIPTNAIGIMRGGESQEPHAGDLVRAVLEYAIPDAIYDELRSWYLHEAGFFAGRGTAKAPDPRPIRVELADIARLIDRAWRR